MTICLLLTIHSNSENMLLNTYIPSITSHLNTHYKSKTNLCFNLTSFYLIFKKRITCKCQRLLLVEERGSDCEINDYIYGFES